MEALPVGAYHMRWAEGSLEAVHSSALDRVLADHKAAADMRLGMAADFGMVLAEDREPAAEGKELVAGKAAAPDFDQNPDRELAEAESLAVSDIPGSLFAVFDSRYLVLTPEVTGWWRRSLAADKPSRPYRRPSLNRFVEWTREHFRHWQSLSKLFRWHCGRIDM